MSTVVSRPLPAEAPAPPGLIAPTLTAEDFQFLRRFVHEHCGIALSEQKRPLVQGRLARRLRTLQLPDFASYCVRLREQPDDELGELASAISTNVTAFFREPHHYQLLQDELLPRWLERAAKEGGRLRIWSAGCATGEEPYALAMLLAEAIEHSGSAIDARILATDLSPRALDTARRGIYAIDRLEGISPERRRRWMLRGQGSQHGNACVHPRLRELVRFAPLNLLHAWPMPGRFDAVFCRNVVIYFDQPTKQQLFERFAEALRDDGILFLGHSESMHGLNGRFELVGRTVYRRHAV